MGEEVEREVRPTPALPVREGGRGWERTGEDGRGRERMGEDKEQEGAGRSGKEQ